MPILQLPSGVEDNHQLMCVVCAQPVSLAEATAGSMTAKYQQAFAHESHRVNRAAWLFCWLRFQYEHGLIRLDVPPADFEVEA